MKIVSFAKKRKSGLFGFPGSSCTPSCFFLVFSCSKVSFVRFLQQSFVKFLLQQRRKQIGRAHEGRSAADCRARSRSARDQPYPVDVCSSLSPFTFVLTRAHLPPFHSHFLTAHNSGTVFLKFCL